MALLEDRPILVFDEWAADQDPQYKDMFYRDILPSMRAKGKLVIVLSHDERYFHLGDRVLWLERGERPVWRTPQSFAEDRQNSRRPDAGGKRKSPNRPSSLPASIGTRHTASNLACGFLIDDAGAGMVAPEQNSLRRHRIRAAKAELDPAQFARATVFVEEGVPTNEEEDAEVYLVVINAEEQYSIWPSRKDVPQGWRLGRKARRQSRMSQVYQ